MQRHTKPTQGRSLRLLMQEKRLSLKLLTCALKVTLQDGAQVGMTLEVYLHLPGVPSSIQTAMPRVETELRRPDGDQDG